MIVMMPARPTWYDIVAMLAAAVAPSCSSDEARRSAEPPAGFGVTGEDHLAEVLVGYAFSRDDAECVARHAFASNPSTDRYADGSYDITQDMLSEAGGDCGIDWSDYNFATD